QDDAGVVGATDVYTDADGDSYGLDGSATPECFPAKGAATVGGDCDDSDGGVNPSAIEVCDAIDNDCDTLIDDDDASVVGTTNVYTDSDGDSYGLDGTATG